VEWPSSPPDLLEDASLEIRMPSRDQGVCPQCCCREHRPRSVERFSSWPRLLRVTAIMLRWSPRWRDNLCTIAKGTFRLLTFRLTTATHCSRCLEAFHCSSAVSGWWSIATWANRRHSITNHIIPKRKSSGLRFAGFHCCNPGSFPKTLNC